MATWRRSIFLGLDRPGRRWILGLLGTARVSLRRRRFIWIHHDRTWLHHFGSATIASPDISPVSPEMMEQETREVFLYEYTPKPNDTIIDVGAGIGTEALTFSKLVSAGGRVFCFEAHPKTFFALQRLCELNGLKNVIPINAAVADKPGSLRISDIEVHSTNSVFGAASQSGIDVPAVPLDEFAATNNIDVLDFLKVNIEGAERLAILGMTRLIRRTRHVAISCHDFLAEEAKAPEMRTREIVREFLLRNDFELTTRDNDPRGNIRDFIYGRNKHLP